MRRLLFLPLIASLAGCADYPDLPPSAADTDGTAWPTLVPLSTLETPEAPTDAAEEQSAMAARVAAVKARADRLRAAE